MKYFLIPIISLFTAQIAFGQFTWNSDLILKGMVSTKENQLPFWMVHNQRGRFSERTNLASLISGKVNFTLSNNSKFEFGTGLLARDGVEKNLIFDELYTQYETNYWSFTIGRKQQELLYNGISASNRSILWSINARPLPGIQFKTIKPIFFLKNFGFEVSWEEYLMDDNRYINNAKLHHKSFHIIFSPNDRNFEFKTGLQHFGLWGGNSPLFGKLPNRFEDYLRIITGRNGGGNAQTNDQQNALGNHLGGYEIELRKKFKTFNVQLFYNHLFEDGSGSRLGNTPDGRYGIYLTLSNSNKLINSVIYEFYTTHHQSHTTSGIHKNDNYFNNWLYRSGWTYHSKVLGAPFFTINPDGLGIINNKFTAHNGGFTGNLPLKNTSIPYKFILSYAQNDGTRPERFKPKQDAVYLLSEINILKNFIDINLQMAAEYNSLAKPIYGTSISLKFNLLNEIK